MRLFRNIGIICIMLFSFFYTEKIANYMLENNDLYKTIASEKDNYEVASVNALINGNYIIPGLNGKVVDVRDSYYNMKDMEIFNSYYLMYDVTYPEVSLNSNIDKIINKGNSAKRCVSFILEYDEDIINYFEDNNYPASVVVIKDTFRHESKLEQLNGDVSNFDDLETLLSKYSINPNICYVTLANENICRKHSKYLVKTDKIINNSTIIDIKNNIESGDIYYINKNTDIKNIQLIINSISFKDLNIVNVSELVSEDA